MAASGRVQALTGSGTSIGRAGRREAVAFFGGLCAYLITVGT
jgi:hypothetical protein